jgi:hypothetical protein
MAARVNAELWDRWIELWNGNLDVAEHIIHPDFEIHRVPMPHVPEGLGGRDTLVEWVKQTRSILGSLRFTVEVGPIVDGEIVAGRWLAEGSYEGGIPGATAPTGTRRLPRQRHLASRRRVDPRVLAERRPSRSVATIGRRRRPLIDPPTVLRDRRVSSS